MTIKHRTANEVKLENEVKKLIVENDTLSANLDYVAMMTDVDIPTEEEEN